MATKARGAARRAGGGAVLAVGVLGLGPRGGELARAAAATIAAAWSRIGAVRVATADAGDSPRSAAATLRRWADREGFDAVLTVGRAGHRAEDFAPEATEPLLARRLPGVEERMQLAGRARAASLLFRGRAGMRGGTLVVNLPEHPALVREIAAFLAPVVVHATAKARGDGAECGRGAGS